MWEDFPPNGRVFRRPAMNRLCETTLPRLIATAKTPAEHLRIEQYYKAKALDYLAQAKEHEEMLEIVQHPLFEPSSIEHPPRLS